MVLLTHILEPYLHRTSITWEPQVICNNSRGIIGLPYFPKLGGHAISLVLEDQDVGGLGMFNFLNICLLLSED